MQIRLTYVPLSLACLALLLTLIPLLGPPRFSAEWFFVLVASIVVGGPLTHFEWRRSRRAIAMFYVVVLVIPLVSAGSVLAFFDDEAPPVAWGVLAGSALSMAAMAAVLWSEHRLRDRLPNALSERFLDEQTFEDDGVQWAVECTGIDAASPLLALFYLQNNIDSSRTVTIRLRPETGFFGGGDSVRWSPIPAVELPPAAEASVSIPLVATETRPRPKIDVFVSVDAKGPHGPRNRRQRVGPGPRRTPRWLALFAPLAGHFIRDRGGMRIALRSSGASSIDLPLEPVAVQVREASPPKLFDGALG